ncbi:MAG: hypothetical protein HQL52_18795 [Magnetococcales bacterium]|nr:hypothetical protein [Magnetococcales bacterium]
MKLVKTFVIVMAFVLIGGFALLVAKMAGKEGSGPMATASSETETLIQVPEGGQLSLATNVGTGIALWVTVEEENRELLFITSQGRLKRRIRFEPTPESEALSPTPSPEN